jgi:enoyl-CoA hydratase/carnithine racemase
MLTFKMDPDFHQDDDHSGTSATFPTVCEYNSNVSLPPESAMPLAAASAASSDAELLRSENGGIVTLMLNRSQQFNALSSSLIDMLQREIDSIAADSSVRVVVIAGAGRAFCAGHDLKEMRAARDPNFAEDVFARCSRLMLTLTQMPQPVIARVHAFAFAAGCQLVAQCDLAVAATTAQFATSGVKFGLFCSTPGVALARNVSRKQAMEMLLTGEPIDAATALQRGLVNRVVEPDALDAETDRLARSIIEKTPIAIAAGKRAFYEQVDAPLAQAYESATRAMVCNMMSEDAAEGIDAFAAKRKPVWTGK